METIMTAPHVVVKVEKEEEDSFSEGSGSDGAQDATGDDGSETEDIKDTKEEDNPNAGWAEAMAKILGKKTSESKPTILVRNKKLEKIQAEEKKERLEKKKQVDKKRTWENMFRQKPDVVSDREHEKNLQRTATRGVVQLFNAVKKHQKDVSDRVKTAGGSDRKKAKILSSITKRDFIDVLRGVDTPQAKTEETVEVKEEAASWSVLKDDFMMGATMKDWDQESHDSHEGHADHPSDCDGVCSSDEPE